MLNRRNLKKYFAGQNDFLSFPFSANVAVLLITFSMADLTLFLPILEYIYCA